ncbi:hypothetical protein [Falsiroseomonas sp.]|uniref:hypothetical protein n=1 Tax=Falsiroseomonas sp. TaxID=2870721 RepID=UPI00271E9C98|nr:hypothetical protein [Falsiroseomonas sp.]MDO9499091.1 hypothetical protein [Falsiroseomonas sp.]MDP3415702.1 hypothetical protein [Falsiroseomonas sp.]
MPKCLTCGTPVNAGKHFCDVHIPAPKAEKPHEKMRRQAQEKQMAASLALAKENEPKFLKKQKDGMEAAALAQAKAKEIAGQVQQAAAAIANLVKGYRNDQPGTNAGSNGTQGGTNNPLTFDKSGWGGVTPAEVTPYIKGFDNSISGVSKIRFKHEGHQDVLVHIIL